MSRPRAVSVSAALLAVAGVACGPIATAGPDCRPLGSAVALPEALHESSGAAVSRRDPEVIWTHGDGPGVLYAVGADGAVTAEYRLPFRLRDWEDLDVGACGAGGSCLYLADTGDNFERRPPGGIGIVRLTEPDGRGGEVLDAEVFPVRLPDGPRDIEALFVLPGERIYLVTKGRKHPLSVYSYPPPLRPDTVTVVEVQRLSGGPMPLLAQVTGSSASADGSIVAIRTYQSLEFFHVQGDTLAPTSNGLVNLRSLEEIQGEGVGLGPDGLVVLTSEGGPLGGPGSMRLLRCAVGS